MSVCTPEARLHDLIDLAERITRARNRHDFGPHLTPAFDEASRCIAERIRAVSAEMVKAPSAPRDMRSGLEVGDRVRVISNVDRIAEGWDDEDDHAPLGEGVIVERNDCHPAHMCWEVRVDGREHYHSARELERV